MNTASKNKITKLLLVCLLCVGLVYGLIRLIETF
jgi:hypothetical protein